MSWREDVSPTVSPRNSLRAVRSNTPDIIEPEIPSLSAGGGFNLAAELAMAEDGEGDGYLSPPKNRGSTVLSDYEGSEYGDIDDDSDGYLNDHVDSDQQQLQVLVDEVTRKDASQGPIAQFVHDLRRMRGQLDVENNARRLITMQKSLASALDHHSRLLRDIPVLSPILLQDDTFLELLTSLSLPAPVTITNLLSESSLDLTALSDTLAMARQEQLQISRKLRSVKDAWMERKDEWDILEARIAWLTEHDSLERRARGSCTREVHGVVRGLDKVLGGMEREMYRLCAIYC